MNLNVISEIIYNFFQAGKPESNKQTFAKADILQFTKLAVSNVIRKQYYDSKAKDDWGEPDYSLVSPMFSIQRLPLTDTDVNGKRSVDVSKFDVYRLPKNAHFVNVYPVNNNCNGEQLKALSQVSPGEEYFYLKPKYKNFLFYVPKGTNIDTYNIPSCVERVDVESTFASSDIDVAMDVAFDAATFVLNMTLQIKGKYDEVMLRRQLEKEQKLM